MVKKANRHRGKKRWINNNNNNIVSERILTKIKNITSASPKGKKNALTYLYNNIE
jgi:hypothetical protein